MFLSHLFHACLFLVYLHSSSRIPSYLLYGACQQTVLGVSGLRQQTKRPLYDHIAMAAGPYMCIYIHLACICTSQSRQFCSARIHLCALSSFVRTMFANYAHAHGGLTISFTCIVCVWLLQTYFYSFLQG